MSIEVVVYRKPGCPLCDEAEEVLDEARGVFDFELRRVNVLSDVALFERYRYQVPVVEIGGIERLSLRFDLQQVEAALIAGGVRKRE